MLKMIEMKEWNYFHQCYFSSDLKHNFNAWKYEFKIYKHSDTIITKFVLHFVLVHATISINTHMHHGRPKNMIFRGYNSNRTHNLKHICFLINQKIKKKIVLYNFSLHKEHNFLNKVTKNRNAYR